jgi:bifunctional DNA-binding transcriptional regulator/antitoxin component of YhaV-PrlF toxin-antitoxin module
LQIPAAPVELSEWPAILAHHWRKKLGIKPAMTVTVINEPNNYRQLLVKGADGVEFSDQTRTDSRFVHLFTTSRRELEKQLSQMRKKIPDTATIWVSWPKKSAGVPTDVTEDVIRAVALPLGFVDVKVCAIDETWSGLKLMVRRSNRKLPATK